MTEKAETLFEPKRILTSGDWLVSHKEAKQSYDWYSKGNGGHKWIGGDRKTVYLFCIDDTITEDNAKKYKMYAEAMFDGAKIEIAREG
jgi:hypothetical protein